VLGARRQQLGRTQETPYVIGSKGRGVPGRHAFKLYDRRA
jgi:hypothetical protein